ncbi:MAG: gamma-glutamyltransferase, partial [Burkholderiales bacterium]|nr:gamma-glutamyltransferase [Burkholderiales bacterium]
MISAAGRLAFAALILAAGAARAQPAPEAASGRTENKAVTATRHMVVAANPLAAQAGLDILRAGGSAMDAAIAAQLALNVVEPQSSGIGGGAFLLHFDAARAVMAAYDGRETAPASARPERFLDASGQPLRYLQAVGSGLSVGVPGLVRMLALAHARHGVLAWERLFEPAIRLADGGFAISPRLALLIDRDPLLRRDAAARALFYRADGSGRPAGEMLRNPALATTLRSIAAGGPEAFYKGEIARDIVAAVRGHPVPGDLSLDDLVRYRARERMAVCGAYRMHRVCGVPPPSSGGVTVALLLGLLERLPVGDAAPLSVRAIHWFSEAGKLAYADRDHYLADPDFAPFPYARLLDRDYLAARSSLIREDRTLGTASPGRPAGIGAVRFGRDRTPELPSTSHLSIVDSRGNAVALTSSIESAFGSRILVRGFLLNNQLTDFSWLPESGGAPAANRVEGGKRPRSSMAPTLVFGPRGSLRFVLGSPGGNEIINYVALTLMALVDWGLDALQAIDLPRYGSRNRGIELERVPQLEPLARPLADLGHSVRFEEQ